MAASPTELLAVDVEQLRESDRRLGDEIKGLTASVNGLREDFAGWKGSVETELNLIRTLGKWILAAFTSIAIVSLTAGSGLIWQAGSLSAEVRLNAVELGRRIDKLEVAVEKRMDKLEVAAEKPMEKLEVAAEKRMEKVEVAAEKRMEKVEGRMDRLEAKLDARLDLIIQRLDQIVPKPKAN